MKTASTVPALAPDLDPIQSIDTGFATAGGYFARAYVARHPPAQAYEPTKEAAITAVRRGVQQTMRQKGA